MSLTEMLDEFPNKKILIIGDVMLDKYSHCNVRRISPEAPIQIAEVQKETYIPGGAGNSANNIASLSAEAYIIGVIGKDYFGKILKKELKKKKINIDGLVEEKNRPTTLKQRVIAHKQQLLRMDYETREEITKRTEKIIINYIKKKIKKFDGIIISDYAKGIITKNLVEKTITLAQPYKIPVVIDTRPEHKTYYKNATVITPNEQEARAMAGMTKEPIEEVGKRLVKDLNTIVLITRGDKGMTLFKKNGNIKHFPTVAKEVYDVSGAGDTATAALTLAITTSATIEEAVELSNLAAGIVVGKIGTATTTIKEIAKYL
jgi:D-beta-D-heptose 7-phosphate kinase/D-beta-D-heptose 1-phosphate adenosyltransferase